MKKLLLILLLSFIVPSVLLTSQEKSKKELANEAKERAKEKKAAIRKLKTLLTMTYRNWYWSGEIYKDDIDESTTINLLNGNYFFLTLILTLREDPIPARGLSVHLPESYLPEYEGKQNGPKTLKIQGRFEGAEKFEAVLHSENNPYIWHFWPGKIKNVKGETIEPMNDIFSYQKLFIEFQTNKRSRYQGEYKIIGFDTSGAKEVYDAAEAILLN